MIIYTALKVCNFCNLSDCFKPDKNYRVCLTGIFTRDSIKRHLREIQGEASL